MATPLDNSPSTPSTLLSSGWRVDSSVLSFSFSIHPPRHGHPQPHPPCLASEPEWAISLTLVWSHDHARVRSLLLTPCVLLSSETSFLLSFYPISYGNGDGCLDLGFESFQSTLSVPCGKVSKQVDHCQYDLNTRNSFPLLRERVILLSLWNRYL